MSRIFGLFDSELSISSDQRNRIAEGLRTPACEVTQNISVEAGSLVWTGWQEPGLCSQHNCLAVVDGFFYDIEGSTSSSDSNPARALIESYRQHGFKETLSRINGDFAVALYDLQSQELFLGRDRFGARPLFFTQTRHGIAFASRPRPLLQLPGATVRPNQRFAAAFAGLHYRYFDNVPTESPYEGIEQLPAAQYLRFHDSRVEKRHYWKLEDLPNWEASFDEFADRYQALLLDAVKVRLQAADRPAFTLSGGMDSSSVLASAVKVSGQKQHAISTVYEDKTYDESDDIKTILGETVEKWNPISVGNPDVFSIVSEMVATNDEPVATATWLSHYMLCRSARDLGYRSLFGGLGGDELNAGEYEYFIFHFADLVRQGRKAQLATEIEKWAEYHDHPIFKKNAETAQQKINALVDLARPGHCRLEEERYNRYTHLVSEEHRRTISPEPTMEHPFSDYLKNRTYQDLSRETAPCCLRAEDRHTVHFGLDNFLPFFDHRLVEFMFRVPGDLKIRNGVTKHLMRHAMRGILPDETRNRITKTGWNAPAHQWFSREQSEPLFDMIRSQAFRERGLYDHVAVEKLLNEHHDIVASNQPKENHMMFFWQLVNAELWLRSVDDISADATRSQDHSISPSIRRVA